MRRTLALILVLTGLCFTATAQAETTGSSGGSVGFAMEVDLAAVAPVMANELLVVPNAVTLAPRLVLGAQIRRFFIGLQASISFYGARGEDADDYSQALWSVRIGPALDGEVWTSGRIALVVGGSLTALILATENDDYHANGFSVDLFFGGRVYVVDQLAIQLMVGSDFSAIFTEIDIPGDDLEATSIGWTLYGALGFRFVAGR